MAGLSCPLLDFPYRDKRATTVSANMHSKEDLSMDTREVAATELPNTTNVDETAVAPKASVKSATSSKPKKQKVAQRPKPAGKTSGQEKLVCRYCGSGDLSPSFKKRRDARCRACFAKRYSSKTTGKKTKRAKKA